jgi:hypothetical protein
MNVENWLKKDEKLFKDTALVVEERLRDDIEEIVTVAALSGLIPFKSVSRQYAFSLCLLSQLLKQNKIALLRKDKHDTQD